MSDKNLNEDLEKQKIGELLENIFTKKEELYYNCKDFFENYLSYSFNYFQNLKNLIIKYDKLKILGQYEEILVSFMIELANIQCNIFNEYISALKMSIDNEISEYVKELKSSIEKIKISEEEYNKEIDEKNILKNKYNKSLEIVENYLINYYNDEKNKEIPNNEEFESIINEAKLNEKCYRSKINDINDLKIEVLKIRKNNLNIINDNRKKIINILSQNIKIFSSSIKNKYEREKKLFDQKHNKIQLLSEYIPIEIEIPEGIKFIKDISFYPYKCNISKNDNSLKHNNSIIHCLKKNFKYIASNYDEYEEEKSFLSKYIDLIFEDKKINEDDYKNLFEKLEMRNYRFVLLSILNKKRVQNHFNLKVIGFKQLGNIIQNILKKSDNDIECIRYSIIMCSTYYTYDKKEKIYLIKYLYNLDYFKTKNFWLLYINHVINEELEKSSNSTSIKRENENEKKKRINNILFTTLLEMTQNMIDLYVKIDIIVYIISYYVTQYNLDTVIVEQLTSIIELNKKKFIPFDENALKE